MNQLFSPLPPAKSRWKVFLVSWGGQSLALLLVLNVHLLYPEALPRAQHVLTHLVSTPPPISHEPQPENPKLVEKLRPIAPPVTETHLQVPPLPTFRKQEAPVKAPDLKEKSAALPLFPPTAVPTPRVIVTNNFSSGSSAMPTTTRPTSKVQTGGFGDPNGIPATGTPSKPANIAALGSFDLPVGPGSGNGSGGSHGTPGVAVSAGFGSGVAIGSSGVGSGRREIHQGGFGDVRAVSEEPKKKSVATASPTSPVEILFKPNPTYTNEGRKLRIEGEVKLEVLFTADGKVEVKRLVKGLGHGLDEEAVKAAQQIRFKPAQRDGQAVDSTATLRIIFQLA